ncbi:MAG: hypothetical protein UT53_C0006G0004 [Candidatus Yanofskybacteria bacterium GW2011_GWD2_39_48]|uniref:Uncharacterized protein n=1 Tax=Candidatus Yanofskybacteria bacterium GW2011_GWD2_39_48 TaxID=1619031 RepID=A0A0G0P6F1_9BACT|nr:MAG: hypothetical protein UT53_C0006G0004 [Candidatus Yanofskybacteria bacterium GW2011_GWD2_39_48]
MVYALLILVVIGLVYLERRIDKIEYNVSVMHYQIDGTKEKVSIPTSEGHLVAEIPEATKGIIDRIEELESKATDK